MPYIPRFYRKECDMAWRAWVDATAMEHGRRNVHDYFLLLLCKSSIKFTERHIFKIIIYLFNTLKCAASYFISFEVYDG